MFNTHRTYSLSTGVKNNTIAVISDPRRIKVIYHKTEVFEARLTPTGWTITLRNGGWDTVSTRIVINRALEQLCGTPTYLERRKNETYLVHNGLRESFVSGMTLKTRRQSGAA